MTTKEEVKTFLSDFHLKMSIWSIIFRTDRAKNVKTLADLEITGNDQRKIIENLDAIDYSEGPKEDTLNKGTDLWVFGKIVKNKEVYIKITMGKEGRNVICISFHISEHPMTYPFKNQ